MLYKNPRPHPLTPSPPGEGELNLLLPSPGGRGAGGEGETLQPRGFHVKLTPLSSAVPLPVCCLIFILQVYYKKYKRSFTIYEYSG
ncbi:hypothetical protein NIES37_50410 [Tolypothrix tenuis PCC 7101]|uniref:Uncharacterized protein n=1 Tax=Tolypothrix tenuis PCC 7101 TaxID=231146 RepID=A0A1Z4N5N0_9CYAN|nr:hypothetical protein NIES37_50410 [Tolypothrix tenuis PCC 7101]BAZ75034.1 hypothetical protein NIES50_36140 [Aulosira laxa NIES-50]